jgi:hypothetical protein
VPVNVIQRRSLGYYFAETHECGFEFGDGQIDFAHGFLLSVWW